MDFRKSQPSANEEKEMPYVYPTDANQRPIASKPLPIPVVPFSKWKDTIANEHQEKGEKPETTLLEQIKYAKDLYDVSQGTEDEEDIDEETILSNLRATSLDRPLVSPLMGISVDWLLDVFRKLPFVTKLAVIDSQLWFVRKVCIIEMLRRVGVSSGPFVDSAEFFAEAMVQKGIIPTSESEYSRPIVDKATLFLSYTGRYELFNVFELLEGLRGEYIWMDLLCVSQFAWTAQNKSAEVVHFRKELIDGLEDQIRSIGKVALMMEKWDEVLYTVGQVWVLWEMYNTAEANVEFTILMTEEEKQKYLESFEGGEKSLLVSKKHWQTLTVQRPNRRMNWQKLIFLIVSKKKGSMRPIVKFRNKSENGIFVWVKITPIKRSIQAISTKWTSLAILPVY